MNPGLDIFKKRQRLQEGTDDVPLAGRAARKVQDLSISALQNLPEWLKSPIRHGVGRVVTNVVDPFGYDSMEKGIPKIQETAKLFSPTQLPRTLFKILQDQPAVEQSDSVQEAAANARRPLFREYFDLPTQDTDNVFTHQGKNYRINPETKNEIGQFVLDQFSGPMYRPDRLMEEPEGNTLIVGDPPGKPRTNMISRNYFPERPDPWDFAPSSEELARTKGKPLDTALFGRMLLESIGKPATLETGGYANPPPKEDVDAAQNTGGGLARGTSNVQYLQDGTNNLGYDPSYPGPTNPKESGSGYMTQKGVGLGVGTASNFIFPGLGLLTGPLASWAWKAMQSGMAQDKVQAAVANYQQQAQQSSDRGEAPPAVPDSPSDVSKPSQSAGVGIDPEGNPAGSGQWWSPDFGRWDLGESGQGAGGYDLAGPGGMFIGQRGTGFGSGTVGNWGTAIGFGGNLGGSGTTNASALGGGALNRHYMTMLAKGMPIGQNIDNAPAPPDYAWGSGTTISAPGQPNIINPAALGGAASAGQSIHFLPHQQQQMGTSNVGLNLFRRKQMQKKPKP